MMSITKPNAALSSQARSALRAAAHSLRPVVMVGDAGLTPAVLKEIEVALSAHELIKVRVSGQERSDRDSMLETICNQLGCVSVAHLGKILIVYRVGKKPAFSEQTGVIVMPPKRKPSEPHTPKKMAALGKRVKKKSRPAVKRIDPSKPSAIRAFSAEKSDRSAAKRATRPARATSTTARPARKSALSLRAGARRGLNK
uniref:YhbY family RNA-binding protein n=1 Tax=Orrella sp. TaxID=1921583 RepID=UPI004047BDF2